MKGTLIHKSNVVRFLAQSLPLNNTWYEYLDHLCLPGSGVVFHRMNSVWMNSVGMNRATRYSVFVNSIDRCRMNNVDLQRMNSIDRRGINSVEMNSTSMNNAGTNSTE